MSFTIAANSLYDRSAIEVRFLHNRCVNALQSLYNRCENGAKSVRNHSAMPSHSLCAIFAAVVKRCLTTEAQSLHKHFAIEAQTLRERHKITLQNRFINSSCSSVNFCAFICLCHPKYSPSNYLIHFVCNFSITQILFPLSNLRRCSTCARASQPYLLYLSSPLPNPNPIS
jgi:hypothetical protein